MALEAILSKFGISLTNKGLSFVDKKLSKRKQKELLAEAISELLSLNPNIHKAEAKIIAAEATGVDPTGDLLFAKEALVKVKEHKRAKPKKKAAIRKKAAAKKKAVSKKKAVKKKATKKKQTAKKKRGRR